MAKIYTVVLLKDKSGYFDTYLDEVFAFNNREDAKSFLDEKYNQKLNELADDYKMTVDEILREDVSSLDDDEFVVGCDGGATYYYGHLKETIIQ